VQLSPNPVGETLTIRLKTAADEQAKVFIFNAEGQLKTTHTAEAGVPIKLNVKNWKSGVYTIISTTNTHCHTTRFVKI
jgi:hypothetical protein